MIKKTLVALAITGSILAITGCGKKEVVDHKMVTLQSGEVTPKITIGSNLDIKLKDQFDKVHTLTDSTQKVIFAFSKATGHMITDFLATKSEDFLTKNEIFYVADVSRMPSLILDYAVLPGIKELKYPMILLLDEAVADKYKSTTNGESIMVLTLDKKKITKVNFVTNIADFEKSIK